MQLSHLTKPGDVLFGFLVQRDFAKVKRTSKFMKSRLEQSISYLEDKNSSPLLSEARARALIAQHVPRPFRNSSLYELCKQEAYHKICPDFTAFESESLRLIQPQE